MPHRDRTRRTRTPRPRRAFLQAGQIGNQP